MISASHFSATATKSSGRMAYAMVEDGSITAQGLPAGVPLKTPGKYKKVELQRILADKKDVKFKGWWLNKMCVKQTFQDTNDIDYNI